jgi:LytR cell envelope-related transcriptional attenuator
VDHPLAQTELIRPWRTATLVAIGIAAVELVLLIAAGVVLIGRQIAPHAHAATRKPAAAKPTVSKAKPAPKETTPARTHRAAVIKLSRAQTKVVVLNGNGVSGAAAQAASLVRARGYQVTEVGNAPRTGYAHTILMYRPHFRAEALRFRRDLNLSTVVAPLDGMTPRQLKDAHLVEILGSSS